jgi:glycosyltransferase involved in cell wall biosynthesis
MPHSAKTCIVVPCYNEAARLPVDDFTQFASEHSDVRFLFVDDGSTDDTLHVLRDLAERDPEAFGVVEQKPNRGKGEAVRVGMNRAFSEGATYAGFWDADLSTPLDAIPDFVDELDSHPSLEVLFGSRIRMLGRRIDRLASRHYLGRVSATAISLTLGLTVYDTQCGAKLFRVSPECKELFETPFSSRWIFDVEIIARMKKARRESGSPGPEDVILEMPLWEWRDVEGSKVNPSDFFRSMLELVGIWRRYLRTG